MNTLQEMRDVIDGAIAGKDIEYISGTYANAHNASHWMNRPESMGAFNFKDYVYRVKPEPKIDIRRYVRIKMNAQMLVYLPGFGDANLCIVFDGETGELKVAEVIKP